MAVAAKTARDPVEAGGGGGTGLVGVGAGTV